MHDRVKKHYKNQYTVADNKILQDKRLSYLAVGIFMYLWSKSDDWQVIVKQLMKRNNTSEHKVRQGLRELRDCGYIKWVRIQSGFLYELNDCGEFIDNANEEEVKNKEEIKDLNTDIHYNDNHYNEIQHNIYNKQSNDLKESNDKEKIYKKEISISKKEDLEQIKENHFEEIYKTFCEKEDLQERTIKSKEYQDTFKKYQNALKKYSHEEILKGIQDYIIFLQCQRNTGFNRDKQGIIPFFNQEKFLGEKGSSWQELIDKMSEDIQNEVVNKLKFTRLKQKMRSQIKQKENKNFINKLIENSDF